MRFLRDGDAAIIDLRHNGGGSPEAVQYLVSHFMEPNRPLVTFHMGAQPGRPPVDLAELPAGRMVGKPLYVLTSGHTASAAEEFTGHVAGFRLGEVIGETTAGAGFRNEFFALPGGYVISVSVGRAVLAATGKDWEGVGINPTVRDRSDKALEPPRIMRCARSPRRRRRAEKASSRRRAALLAAQVEPVATGAAARRPMPARSASAGCGWRRATRISARRRAGAPPWCRSGQTLHLRGGCAGAGRI